jgi:hypothetical protein
MYGSKRRISIKLVVAGFRGPGIEMGYWLNGQDSLPGRGKRFLCTPQRPDRLWGPFSLLSIGYRGYLPGVKRPGREAGYSPPYGAEAKTVDLYLRSLTHLPSVVLN